jgi:hypothetical protein
MQDVKDGEVSSVLKNAHHLSECRLAIGRGVDVVDHQAGEHYIERAILERQSARVAVFYLHSPGDPFDPRVS